MKTILLLTLATLVLALPATAYDQQAVDAAIATLQQATTELADANAALITQVETLTTTNAGLQVTVEQLTTANAGLETNVNQLLAANAELEVTIAELEAAGATTMMAELDVALSEIKALGGQDVLRNSAIKWRERTVDYMQRHSDSVGADDSNQWTWRFMQALTQGMQDSTQNLTETELNANVVMTHFKYVPWRVGEFLALDAYAPDELRALGAWMLKWFPNPEEVTP